MPSSSPSTHQDTHSTPSLHTAKPKPLTSKFTEGRMQDEPSGPPPRKYIDSQPSARSSSETARTDTHVAIATYEQPPRSASEPVEVSSWVSKRFL
ncbi:uncharacterized protein EAF02_005576 [Botrytis sinoallii]|uniref:uncharacterized protein n=1 Tax=Botrytis sinoallii TaxID=1463999 RepID=UPI0019028613|nr:uncharacterized protein EAF02_005576 [Botrytis sinoallii]KAF7883656.1 hypothetical protein EAF02_005576 [Botrytis sinoallii]